MEEWQQIATREAEEVLELLLDDGFTRSDLRDRLRQWLEYVELAPDQPTHEETD